MRTVYPAAMVAHIWANRGQDTARTQSHNLFFVGPTLYSYGRHYVIAHHLDGDYILWNDLSYSATTNRHKTLAWNAIPAAQHDRILCVPNMDENKVRQLTRAIRDHKMPDLAQECADKIIDIVSRMVKMRHGFAPMILALEKAREYEKTGRHLCAMASKGRKIVRWPLPLLPESVDGIPANSAERAAFIRQYAKHKLLREYENAITVAREAYAIIAQDFSAAVNGFEIEYAHNALNRARRACSGAIDYYMAANGKKPVAATRLQKQIDTAAPAVEQAYDAHLIRNAVQHVRKTAIDCYCDMRARKRAIHAGKTYAPNVIAGHWRMDESITRLKAFGKYDLIADYMPIIKRAMRAQAWDRAAEHIECARGHIETAEIRRAQRPLDAMHEYKVALRYVRNIRASSLAFADLHANTLADIERQCKAAIKEIEAEIKAHEAAIIEEWISGRSNVRPQYGTYARIKGDIVETSRGAFVPLAHACRLAKIARRVISEGGREWAPGTGPIVGHFRVTRIGGDGSATIGCHEFDATEGMRLIALLENCTECQTE